MLCKKLSDYLQVACLGFLLTSASGCVREVLSGEDPQARAGRLTGKAGTDELVVRIPWMEIPQPRLLIDDKLIRSELIFARMPDGLMHFTLRTSKGTTATIDARAKRLPDDSMEFTYKIISLPPKYVVDTAIELKASGIKPDISISVNGAPAKVEAETEVVVVQLSRDAVTKILAIPKFPPAPATPAETPATSSAPTVN